MNKEIFTPIIGFMLLVLFLLSSPCTQAAPEHENKSSEEKRSFPLSIEQEDDIIYLYSRIDFSNLQIVVSDMSGNELQKEYIAVSAQAIYSIYIDSLSVGNQYILEIYQEGNHIIAYIIYN